MYNRLRQQLPKLQFPSLSHVIFNIINMYNYFIFNQRSVHVDPIFDGIIIKILGFCGRHRFWESFLDNKTTHHVHWNYSRISILCINLTISTNVFARYSNLFSPSSKNHENIMKIRVLVGSCWRRRLYREQNPNFHRNPIIFRGWKQRIWTQRKKLRQKLYVCKVKSR